MQQQHILKLSIFCTGITGITAEYIMATIASWCLGDAVTQWTLVISLMLFAMGIGSQLSRTYEKNLFDTFIYIELTLALLVSLSPIAIYTLFGITEHLAFFIYLFAFLIGLLVGLELPLATRLNASRENLKTNLSAMLSRDYFGALVGGIFFAFLALPHLGLPRSAAIVGTINCAAALMLGMHSFTQLQHRKTFIICGSSVVAVIIAVFIFGDTLVLHSEQRRYRDKIVFSKTTRYQKIVITEFKNHHWLYLDGNLQFSTIDEHRYHEPLVHPAMLLASKANKVLLLGGGDGLAAREILLHQRLQQLTVVDIDPQMTELARTYPLLVNINAAAFHHPKANLINTDAFTFLQKNSQQYDVIIADFPDPRSADLARLYSRQFFLSAFRNLRPDGVFITQAGSPLFARRAFLAVLKTIRSLYPALPLHTSIASMGDRGWVLAVKNKQFNTAQLYTQLAALNFTHLPLHFLDRHTLNTMLGEQGKNFYAGYDDIHVNSLSNLSLYRYYQKGQWELY